MTERHLTILQINDLHGYLEPHPEAFRGRGKFNYRTCGGLARIASIFKRVRGEHPGGEHPGEVLALDNGDTFHGTFVAGQSRGEAMLPMMNALEFDAMTLVVECEVPAAVEARPIRTFELGPRVGELGHGSLGRQGGAWHVE